jgi:hypothetical protein
VIQSFRFSDELPWPLAADGGGASLELKNPLANPLPGKAASWTASTDPGGTPGGQTVSTYAVWRQRYFPDGGADSGPLADPDGDGIPNLLEFATGSPPLVANTLPGGLNPDISPADGAECLSMPQRRRTNCAGAWVLESSTDLTSWTPQAHTLKAKAGSDGTEEITAFIGLSDAPRRWLRFRYSEP